MTRLIFTEDERQALHKERFEHPHPRVQQRMEVLWLISQGIVYSEAARLGGVAEATVDRYVAVYRQGGLEALRELKSVSYTHLPNGDPSHALPRPPATPARRKGKERWWCREFRPAPRGTLSSIESAGAKSHAEPRASRV